ncbi:MAG: methyltransferase, partial [Cyanobium sp.]
EHYLSWDGLLGCIRTGENGFRSRYGTDVFTWYSQHPERAAVFNGAMGDLSRLEVLAFLDAYPSFAEISHLVDVGGCRGELLETVLRRHPHIRGTVFDQAGVLEGLSPAAELAGRLEVQAGDFFSGVPAGADTYLMKHIVHDWHDQACLTILGHIRRAMAPGARLLILEPVIPPGNDPFPGKLLDLNMLVMTEGGRERTAEEYRQLLMAAGFRLERIVPTAAAIAVVEARAAG